MMHNPHKKMRGLQINNTTHTNDNTDWPSQICWVDILVFLVEDAALLYMHVCYYYMYTYIYCNL